MSTRERFGDRDLINGEIAPVPTGHRILKTSHLLVAWAVVGMVPASYGFIAAHPRLSFLTGLGLLAGGTLAGALAGAILVRSARRYGVGFVALCRAAFGPRGARPVLAIRWLLGLVWVVLWALETANWTRRLLLVGPLGVADGWIAWALGAHLPGVGGIAVSTWVGAALLLLMLWPIARRGMSGLRRWAIIGAATSFASGCGLIVFAGIRSQGFGSWIQRPANLDARTVAVAVAAAALVTLPGLLAAPDWARFRDPERSGARRLSSSLPAIPSAVFLAFVGALVASASFARRGTLDGSPIPDAAGFGGVDAGLGGLLFALGIWFAAGPALGVYSPALALSGLWPRRIGYRRAVGISMAVAVLLVPAAAYAAARGRPLGALLSLAGPLLGVLVADELFLRRGKVLLEELYLFGSEYGPSWGHTLGAWLALLGGWMLHPWVMEFWPVGPPALLRPWLEGAGAHVVAVILGAVVAAVIYLALGAPERRIGRAIRRRIQDGKNEKVGLHRRIRQQSNRRPKAEAGGGGDGKKRTAKAAEPPLAAPLLQDPTAVTDPHFEYGKPSGDTDSSDGW